jgi:hypothetical protein
MTQAALHPLHLGNFSALVAQADEQLSIRLVGVADLNVHEPLNTFLESVHSLVTQNKLEKVNVDLRGLEFINSSCLASIVHWIELREDGSGYRYPVIFTASQTSSWQQRSLRILSRLSCQVETAPAP